MRLMIFLMFLSLKYSISLLVICCLELLGWFCVTLGLFLATEEWLSGFGEFFRFRILCTTLYELILHILSDKGTIFWCSNFADSIIFKEVDYKIFLILDRFIKLTGISDEITWCMFFLILRLISFLIPLFGLYTV